MRTRVYDLMTADPVTVGQNENLDEAYELMEQGNFRHLPVLDSRQNLVGVLTHRDLVRTALFARATVPKSDVQTFMDGLKVREAMTRVPETVSADDDIIDAAQVLFDQKIGCLVVTEGVEVVGILTESDFVKHTMKVEAESREAESAVRQVPSLMEQEI